MKTKRFLQSPLAVAASALLMVTLCACGAKSGRSGELSTTAPLSDELAPAAVQTDGEAGAQTDTYVILNDENTTINGAGAAFENGVLTVSVPGIYQLKGVLSDGKIIVAADCAAGPVTLCLNGVELFCGGDAPLQLLRAAGTTKLVLADGSENRLRGEATDTALFSAGDLAVEGGGTLSVLAPDGVGVCCENRLCLSGGSVRVFARGAGLTAKQLALQKNSSLAVCASGAAQPVEGGAVLTLQGNYHRGVTVRILTDGGDAVASVTPELDCETILLAGGALASGERYGVEANGERTATVTAN